jgi:uncharacterized protein (DUF362 family)/Pyruvate/2-oxoacid:ferredoxin oxidoreductase delta subunit
MDEVVIKKCSEYNLDEVRIKIEQGFELLGGINKFIKKGEKVLLKPNTLTPSPVDEAITTHPIFLQAVIQVIKKQTDKIYVGDSPAVGAYSSASKKTGMFAVIKEEGVQIVDFKDESYEIFSTEKLAYKSFKVDPVIKEMDRIINLPKLKTHAFMLMTMCVKNMFGIIPGLRKVEYHLKAGHDRTLFAKMLVDLTTARPPDLNIMDGIIGMEGNGPGSDGDPVKLGVILMGKNSFAVDTAAATLLGVDPYSVYTNDIYRKYMLKRNDIEYYIKGDRIDGVLKKIKLPDVDIRARGQGFLFKFAKDMLTTKPIYLKDKCTGCLICVKHCPVTALRYTGKEKGIICDYNKCIRCFVCHEICPEKAITIKKPPLAFLLRGGKKK